MSTLLTDIAVGGIMAAIAVFVANRFAGDRKRNKAKYYTIFCVVILLLIGLKDAYVQPKYEEWSTKASFDNEVGNREPYATLKRTFPKDYERIREVIVNSIKAKETRQESFVKGRAVLMSILTDKLKIASDEALTGFMGLSVNTATYYYNIGRPDLAFDIVYDQKSLPRDWRTSLPKEFVEAENDNYKEILTSAAENRPRQMDEVKAKKLIEAVGLELYSEDGDDVQLIPAPLAHPDKKREIAKITVDFYGKIMKLPETDRGMVLRYFVAQP